jgi:alpha-galactosidase
MGYEGGSRFYASNWPTWRKNADAQRAKLVRGDETFEFNRSWEYGSWILESMEKDVPYRIYGNVPNWATAPLGANRGSSRGEGAKLITNLPGDGCVEVACTVDSNGVHPTRYGALPPQMAHICAGDMFMFDLAATAAIDKSKEAAIHALMFDPLTAAVCTPGQIKAMTLEMFAAEKQFLPAYR